MIKLSFLYYIFIWDMSWVLESAIIHALEGSSILLCLVCLLIFPFCITQDFLKKQWDICVYSKEGFIELVYTIKAGNPIEVICMLEIQRTRLSVQETWPLHSSNSSSEILETPWQSLVLNPHWKTKEGELWWFQWMATTMNTVTE